MATPKWPGDHSEKHSKAAKLGWARRRGTASYLKMKAEGKSLKLPTGAGHHTEKIEEKKQKPTITRLKLQNAAKRDDADRVLYRQSGSFGAGGSADYAASSFLERYIGKHLDKNISSLSRKKIYYADGREEDTPAWLKQTITELANTNETYIRVRDLRRALSA